MHPQVAEMADAAPMANPGRTHPAKRQAQGKESTKIPPTPGERLTALRISAGYKTRLDALEAINRRIRNPHEKIAESTYHQHESGIRRITIEAAEKYGQHFGRQPGYILYGETGKFRVPIRGIVGADGIVLRVKAGGTTKTVIAPATEMPGNLTPYEVEGRDLFPMYLPGDVVFYDEDVMKAPPDREALVGRKCVVRTSTSEVVALVVSIQTDGKATLYLPSGKERISVMIRRAAPIVWTKHAA